MKGLAALLASLMSPLRKSSVRVVVWLLVGLVVMVTVYSVLFHQFMAMEDRTFSWATSVYWTLVTMSTLGFGDITFESDLGRIFSVVVLISGALYILVLLPFTIIQFIFAPWMDAREQARAPRKVPDDLRGHIVITRLDVVTQALIARAKRSQVPHVVLAADPQEASELTAMGYRAMVGEVDDPATYRRAGVERASLVVATRSDTANTNIAFTVREINGTVPISATADSPASVDVLELAGCSQVIELASVLGRAMAQRVLGTSGRAHVVGEFGHIQVAESRLRDTTRVGETLGDLAIRDRSGLTVLGLYDQGQIRVPHPDQRVSGETILILGGNREALQSYDKEYAVTRPSEHLVMILGGGRVGRAAANVLSEGDVAHTIVEREKGRVARGHRVIQGDAAELEVLQEAGIEKASAVMVTTHEDDMNIYLTLYCRRLRPEVQILARAVNERNVTTLHRAGADVVLSYASLGATAIWNTLGINHRVVLAEGFELFAVPVPPELVGHPLHDPEVSLLTGAHIAAVTDVAENEIHGGDTVPSGPGYQLLVMGNRLDERRFRERYSPGREQYTPGAGDGRTRRTRA